MHEFALSLSQVEVELLIALADLLGFVLGQPLVGIHDLKTHLFFAVSLGGNSINCLLVFN